MTSTHTSSAPRTPHRAPDAPPQAPGAAGHRQTTAAPGPCEVDDQVTPPAPTSLDGPPRTRSMYMFMPMWRRPRWQKVAVGQAPPLAAHDVLRRHTAALVQDEEERFILRRGGLAPSIPPLRKTPTCLHPSARPGTLRRRTTGGWGAGGTRYPGRGGLADEMAVPRPVSLRSAVPQLAGGRAATGPQHLLTQGGESEAGTALRRSLRCPDQPSSQRCSSTSPIASTSAPAASPTRGDTRARGRPQRSNEEQLPGGAWSRGSSSGSRGRQLRGPGGRSWLLWASCGRMSIRRYLGGLPGFNSSVS